MGYGASFALVDSYSLGSRFPVLSTSVLTGGNSQTSFELSPKIISGNVTVSV